ncbi:MAG: adenylosuccinate synthase [Candidatus Gastranaerophilales bacterium]|nr:adenylosuccinate synthase [Candidatus Gastranaerophilales bacterium]
MKNTVVVGAQWGDEGKAKITDLLAEYADVIIRYQGGCNAGHTVVANNETYKFHLIPSGVLYDNKFCFISAGTVIHPETFLKETQELIERGVNLSSLKISPLATITLPYHIDIDGISENTSGKNKIGTTKKGIGPTYSDKIGRYGLKIQDLYDEEALNARLDAILPLKNKMLEKVFGTKTYSKEEMLEYCKKYAEIFKPYVCDEWVDKLSSALKEDKKILFEGAQGIMLDIDYGTYPYVTSSNPIGGGAATGSGIGPTHIENVIGVTKAYITRVGEGPFVTELLDETGEKIRTIGGEFGTTTGRPRRCGWFDAVLSRYCVLVGGLTEMAITKLDVFDTFDELKVCVAYKDIRDGKIYKDYPTNIYMHKYLEPVYETYKGWKTDITKAKTMDELPENAKAYLNKLQELVGIPIKIVSVGPDREQTIILENPFK